MLLGYNSKSIKTKSTIWVRSRLVYHVSMFHIHMKNPKAE